MQEQTQSCRLEHSAVLLLDWGSGLPRSQFNLLGHFTYALCVAGAARALGESMPVEFMCPAEQDGVGIPCVQCIWECRQQLSECRTVSR